MDAKGGPLDQPMRITLHAAGAGRPTSAVAARMASFADGLRRRGWEVSVVDLRPPQPSKTQAYVERYMPRRLRRLLDAAGLEGDVMPTIGWHARHTLRSLDSGIAMVSVPPFSMLAAVRVLRPHVPLVLDYLDPWSARRAPTPLARSTRRLERWAVRRATAITYAGATELGPLLATSVGLAPSRILSIPNGFDPRDIAGLTQYTPSVARNGTPLDIVYGGQWYARNGPGVLLDALSLVGPSIARLTVIGDISPTIREQVERLGPQATLLPPMPRQDLYRRLWQADAAVLTLDWTSALESRIPAKAYELSALGIPVIAVCPANAAVLALPEAMHFHQVDHQEARHVADLLRRAAKDRAVLKAGRLGSATTRDSSVDRLHRLLLAIRNREI